jgi:hypothetical protein
MTNFLRLVVWKFAQDGTWVINLIDGNLFIEQLLETPTPHVIEAIEAPVNSQLLRL